MSMLSKADPWDRVADGYEASARPVFTEFAAAAMRHVAIQPGQEVADIACGSGALTSLLAEHGARVCAIDFSSRMLRILERNVARDHLEGVSTHHGDGQDLPYEDDRFDAAFSLFGLMFFPDRTKGYAEIFRTLRSGGTACVSSWARLSLSPLFNVMAQTIAHLDPSREAPTYNISSLENPDVLLSEMQAAGFEEVAVHPIERSFAFSSASQLWHGLTEGSAPVSEMRSRLPAKVWGRLSDDAVRFIDAEVGSFPAKLAATAWMATGHKPAA